MRALVALGYKLARAGGPLRIGAIVLGNLIGAYLLLLSIALPEAMFPGAANQEGNWALWGLLVAMLIVPAVTLLISVARLSSGVRDRRLASLRLLGLAPGKTRLVAAVENGVLAVGGVLLGALLFAATTPVLNLLSLSGLGAVPGVFSVSVRSAALALGALVALSMAVGTAATWGQDDARAARSEATAFRPRWWRLAFPIIALAAYGVVLSPAARRLANVGLWMPIVVAAMLLGAVGIVQLTPAITVFLARRLAAWSPSMTVRLAARTTEVDTASTTRVVSGLVVALLFGSVVLGVVGLLAGTEDTAPAVRAAGAGPQRIILWTDKGEPTAADFTHWGGFGVVGQPTLWTTDRAAVAAAFQDLPEVRGVLTSVPAAVLQDDWVGWWPRGQAFVGTCADLALSESLSGFTITGCSDLQPARIFAPTGAFRSYLSPVANPAPPCQSCAISLMGVPFLSPIGQPIEVGIFEMSATPITAYGAFTNEFVPVAFIPAALFDNRLRALGYADGITPITRVDVIADGGAAAFAAVAARAAQHGWRAVSPHGDRYEQFQQTRSFLYAAAGVMLMLSLITVGLSAIDRALERRRNVGRLVMIGVPPSLLVRAQMLQVILPALVSSGLALGFGLLSVQVLAMVFGGVVLQPTSWLLLIGLTISGVAIIVLTTIPLARTRLDSRPSKAGIRGTIVKFSGILPSVLLGVVGYGGCQGVT